MNFPISLSSRIVFIASFAAFMFVLGVMHGERSAGQRHIDYIEAQAAKSIAIVKRHQGIVAKAEVKMLDRVNVIYKQGEEIEKLIPIYITGLDDQRFSVSNGWVRLYDSAFSGEPPIAATELDHEPSELPISAISEVNTHNATACRQWREQALGWREFYDQIRKASK